MTKTTNTATGTLAKYDQQPLTYCINDANEFASYLLSDIDDELDTLAHNGAATLTLTEVYERLSTVCHILDVAQGKATRLSNDLGVA